MKSCSQCSIFNSSYPTIHVTDPAQSCVYIPCSIDTSLSHSCYNQSTSCYCAYRNAVPSWTTWQSARGSLFYCGRRLGQQPPAGRLSTEIYMHRTTRFGMLLVLALLLALGGRDLFAQAPDAQSDTLIRLERVTFDPSAGEPALAQALRSAPKGRPEHLFAPVQWAGSGSVESRRRAGRRASVWLRSRACVYRADR